MYIANVSAIILVIYIQVGYSVWLVAALYHPCIRLHASFPWVRLDTRREFAAASASTYLCCLYLLSRTLIRWPNVLFLACSRGEALWRTALVSMCCKLALNVLNISK